MELSSVSAPWRGGGFRLSTLYHLSSSLPGLVGYTTRATTNPSSPVTQGEPHEKQPGELPQRGARVRLFRARSARDHEP
jgi:hypothetical protein